MSDGTEPHVLDTFEAWPPLPYHDWKDTQATLHRWMQIVGKVKLETTPFLNEWWNVALTVTTNGMTTGLVPYRDEAFSVSFDFIHHQLRIEVTTGQSSSLHLRPQTVGSFYAEFFAELETLGISVAINPIPVEIVNPVSLEVDQDNRAYDNDAVGRWWRIQMQTAKVLQRYRRTFAGKSSPIMFFWGSFDITTVRFSGRRAALPEGAPRFMQLAEDQENMAVGFWPGNDNFAGVPLGEPAFNAYIFPEPEGFSSASILPEDAYHHQELGQFILPYEAARGSANPDATVLQFFESVYDAAATLAGWDRDALELRLVNRLRAGGEQ